MNGAHESKMKQIRPSRIRGCSKDLIKKRVEYKFGGCIGCCCYLFEIFIIACVPVLMLSIQDAVLRFLVLDSLQHWVGRSNQVDLMKLTHWRRSVELSWRLQVT